MKIGNIDREILYIFWATWGISMKFSENMWVTRILKVTKKQGINLSLKDTFAEKPQGGGGVGGDELKLTLPHPSSRFRVKVEQRLS